jgi:class 3 adenylate cyclase/tetratricopeptide (TPR) repeat protein
LKHLVPTFILEHFGSQQQEGELVAGTMFLDLSGFTPLTESLMKEGSAGAERLSDILNKIFGPMVKLVHDNGGFIPYFAGDAFTAIFPESDDQNISRLLHAANDIRNLFGKNNFQFDQFKFGLKIGLSYGKVEWGIIGKNQKSFYFRGPAIENSAESQIRASHQEIVLDSHLNKLLPQGVSTSSLVKGFYLLTSNSLKKPEVVKQNKPSPDIQKLTYQFLPDAVINFIGKGEFRSIISVFCSFEGVESHEELNTFASIFIEDIYNFSGYFKEVDFGDKGGVLVALFGAPISFENNIERTLEFVDSLRAKLSGKENLKFRLGITSGQAFTGTVGGKNMSQFAAVGNRVNLAARLMTYADWGEIFVDEEIAGYPNFNFENKGEIRYKGIEGLIQTFALRERKENQNTEYKGKLISRDKELIKMLSYIRKHQHASRPGLCFLTGEAGVGKSRLSYELQKKLDHSQKINWISTEADQILKKPLNPFVKYLRKHFNCRLNQDEKTALRNFENGFNAILEQSKIYWPEIKEELGRLHSTFKAILDFKTSKDSIYSRLDAEEKNKSVIKAFTTFFHLQTKINPTILFLDDAQWIDKNSKDLIVNLLREVSDHTLIIFFALRPDGIDKPKEFLNLQNLSKPVAILDINLDPLTTSGTIAFSSEILGGQLSKESVDLLQQTSNGNPFYIEQLIEYYRSNQLLKYKNETWHVQEGDIKLNNNINSLLVAKVDNLGAYSREMLKAAAVIGREFEYSVLEEVLKNKSLFEDNETFDNLKASLKEAEKNNIIRNVSKGRYLFKHSMQHEVIYEMQLHTRLKALHEVIADSIERIFQNRLQQRYVDLVFHYERAEITEKTKEYLLRSGDFFKDNFQNNQAYQYYKRLLDIVIIDEDYAAHFKALIRIGEILQITGKWEEAGETYGEALHLSKKLNSKTLMGRANNSLGYLHLLLGNYRDAEFYFDKAIELFSLINDKVGASKVSGNLGLLYFRKAEYKEAEIHFINSLKRSKEVGYRDKNAQIVANLALTYMNLGDYDRGITYLDEQIVECSAIGDKTGIANLSINKGILLTEKGENERAQESLEVGIKLAEELDNKRLKAIATGSLGSLHEQKGYYKMAMDFYLKDLQLTKELGDKQGISIALNLIGNLQSKMGEFDEAIATLEEAISLSEKLDYKKGKAKAVNTLGDVYYFLKEYPKSLNYYDQAIRLTKVTQNQLVLGQSLYEKALVLLETKQYQEMPSILEEATSIAYKLDNTQLLFQLSLTKATYLIQIEQKKDAIKIIEELDKETLKAENKGHLLYVKYLIYGAEELKAEALSILQTLYKVTPDYSIKIKIDALKSKATI